MKSVHSSLISLVSVMTLAGCGDPVKQAQVAEKETAQEVTGITLPKTPVKGQELNAFFPKNPGDFTVVFTQEKPGFSLAELRDGAGAVVGQLSIADLVTNPEALQKFVGAKEVVKGCPVVPSGDTGIAILIGNQFQVQVRSQEATDEDRRFLLESFDLEGLAKKSQAKGTLSKP